jgi:hypothetical protein
VPTSAHTFTRANTDDSDEQRLGTDFVAAVNLHLESGQVFPATGNVLVPGYTLPAQGQTLGLGSFTDGVSDTSIELLYNSAGLHRLVRYDPTGNSGAGSRTTLLEWAGLNLSPTLVPQGGIIDGLLTYLGADGLLRCVNLARTAAGFYTPAVLAADPYALHLAKVPATVPPLVSRQAGSGQDERERLRIIQSRAYQFAYRWRAADGETSVLSAYSQWLDITQDPTGSGTSYIQVTLPPTPAVVNEVEVVVREPDTDGWLLADTLRRTNGVLASSYRFYGVVSGGGVTAGEAGRLFESEWPGKAAGIARGRIFKGDLTEGYPTPEPAFTAEVVTGQATAVDVADVYKLHFKLDQALYGGVYVDNYYTQQSGTYPDPSSTYTQLVLVYSPANTFAPAMISQNSFTYAQAFVDAQPGEADPQDRTLTPLPGQNIQRTASPTQTLHENTSYRVVVQFYDAQGKPGGCSQAKTVAVPAQPDLRNLQNRSLRLRLTTTGAAALNAEIPEWADSYQFLVARNDKASVFYQGLAADALAYLGKSLVLQPDDSLKSTETLKPANTPHSKLWVDLGNWPAAGLGYVWSPQSGDIMRFLEEDGAPEFPITGQQGDYVELQTGFYPVRGNRGRRIEIYTPVTAADPLYYERGPRMKVRRSGTNRSYGQIEVSVEGDCFLAPLTFPVIKYDGTTATYSPPDKKQWESSPAGNVVVESMVPAFRLVPTRDITTTTQTYQTLADARTEAGFVRFGAASLAQAQRDRLATAGLSFGVTSAADTTNRSSTALRWLDMSYGGRPGVQVPIPMQQVRRRSLLRFSGTKVTGAQLNGLSRWEALSQYEKLPQELGAITRLSVADQTQSDGTVLVVNQQQGTTSLYLGQQPIQTSADSQLLSITEQVVGGENTLRGGFGCTDPATVCAYAGQLFWWSRARREVVRYNKGLIPLGLTYKFHTRLKALAATYDGPVGACFDPEREEYWLTFYPTASVPVGTTVVWSERRQAWVDTYSAVPTAGAGTNTELLTWQEGALYRHLPTSPVGTFYGDYTAPQVSFVAASPGAGLAKTWQQVGVRSLTPWLPTELATPSGQQSRILRPWQKFIQGVWRAAIKRDENSPGFAGDRAKALHGGRELQAESLRVTLVCPKENPAPLVGATVDFFVNSGQQSNQ